MSTERERFLDEPGWTRGQTTTAAPIARSGNLLYRRMPVGRATLVVRVWPRETAAVRAVPPAWFWRGPGVLRHSPGNQTAP